MSRGGGRGGRGGGRGRGGFSNGSTQLPMGLSFADIQNLSREATALYPTMLVPVLTESTTDEKRIAELQLGFASRLRSSKYYIVEAPKSTELPRYSDKYRPSPASQPTLKRKDLHAPFFPTEIFEDFFNPKRKRKDVSKAVPITKPRMNLDELNDDGEEPEKSDEERSDAGSQAANSDYDVEEEYDNDYAEDYFDNGEGDDMDDLGGGGGDDGGGGEYD